jgi:ActR/RegA family two-component response regulator
MSSLKDQITDLQNELLVAKDEGKITPEGAKLLDSIQGGQWQTGGFGQFLKGMTLNFSDEGIGALKSFISSDPKNISAAIKKISPQEPQPSPMDVGVALERMGQSEYTQENPLKSIAYQIGGGMLPALVTRRPGPSSTFGQMGLASVAGATSGIGESEAELFSPETGKEAAMGAGIGMASVPVAKGLGFIVGKGYRSAVSAMFDNPQRMGVDQSRAMIREALGADVGGVDDAIKMILDRSGKPYALADIGPNTRAYLDAVNQLPGPGKQVAKNFLEDRDKGLLKRLTSDMQVAFGSKAAYFDEFNALKDARSEIGKKLYGAALPRPVEITSEFTDLLQRPSMKQAYDRAVSLAQEQGIKLPKVQINPETGKLVTEKGLPVANIDTTFMHYMKMGLDDLIYSGKSPTSGMGNTQLGAIKQTRGDFIDLLDASNPAYKRARDYWANDTAVLDAMNEGRSIFSKKPADLDALLNDVKTMSKSEKDALRLGTMQSLLDRLGGAQTGDAVVSAVGNPAMDILKNPKNVRIIRSTFNTDEAGQNAYNKFMSNLMSEVEMKTTSKVVLQGSQTAGRTEAIRAIKEGAQRELPVMTGAQFIMRALQRDFADLGDQQLKATASEIARVLTTTDPAKLQRIAKELAGSDIRTVLRKEAPEVLPILGRALLGPFSIGSLSGNIAPNINQMSTGMLSGQ